MKGKMKEKMNRNSGERRSVHQKNVSEPSDPPNELAPNVSKKNPFWTNYSSIFSSNVQNLTVFFFFLIFYMIRIRFFGLENLLRAIFRLHGILEAQRDRKSTLQR